MEKIKIKNKKRRKKIMIILFSILGVLAASIASVVITSLYINSPTKGEDIVPYANPKSALLVIDLQNDITNSKSYSNTSEFVEKVNQAITHAEENGMEILYIKNEYGNNPVIMLLSGGAFKKGTEGVELDNRVNVINENIFTKSIGDSFSVVEFEKHLISKEVDTLYIVGADAGACVYSTARGGVNRKYNVTIIKDAVITKDFMRDITMKQLEDQYEKEGIETISISEFIK